MWFRTCKLICQYIAQLNSLLLGPKECGHMSTCYITSLLFHMMLPIQTYMTTIRANSHSGLKTEGRRCLLESCIHVKRHVKITLNICRWDCCIFTVLFYMPLSSNVWVYMCFLPKSGSSTRAVFYVAYFSKLSISSTSNCVIMLNNN